MYIERKKVNRMGGESCFIIKATENEKADLIECIKKAYPVCNYDLSDYPEAKKVQRLIDEDRVCLLSLVNSISYEEEYDEPDEMSAIVRDSEITSLLVALFNTIIAFSVEK